jgi:hypothetical protein
MKKFATAAAGLRDSKPVFQDYSDRLRRGNKGLAVAIGTTSLLFILSTISIICLRRKTQARGEPCSVPTSKPPGMTATGAQDTAPAMAEGPPDLREILPGKDAYFASKYDEFWKLPSAAADVDAYQSSVGAYAFTSDM